MGMKWQHRRCEACESEFSPVREAQIHCSPRCRNRLKVRCHRSGYMVRPPTTIQEKRLHAVLPPSEGLTESPTPYFNPHGPTPGTLQGDDHPLTYDANGYPELTACLDRRPKPALAEAA